jgi:hypothetical protein
MTPLLVLALPGLVLVSYLAAAGLHHGVEEPARRLLLRLAGSRRGPARVAVPAPGAVAAVLGDPTRGVHTPSPRVPGDRGVVPVARGAESSRPPRTAAYGALRSVATDTREQRFSGTVRPTS